MLFAENLSEEEVVFFSKVVGAFEIRKPPRVTISDQQRWPGKERKIVDTNRQSSPLLAPTWLFECDEKLLKPVIFRRIPIFALLCIFTGARGGISSEKWSMYVFPFSRRLFSPRMVCLHVFSSISCLSALCFLTLAHRKTTLKLKNPIFALVISKPKS